MFPRAGTYTFVSGGGIEPFVAIGDPTAKPFPLPTEGPRDAPLETWAVVLALVASQPIDIRRRFPVAVFAVTLAAALLADIAYDSSSSSEPSTPSPPIEVAHGRFRWPLSLLSPSRC